MTYLKTGKSVTGHDILIAGESVNVDPPVYFGEIHLRSKNRWQAATWLKQSGCADYRRARSMNFATFEGLGPTIENDEIVEKYVGYKPSYDHGEYVGHEEGDTDEG